MTGVKRETASICQVQDILSGTFVKTEGWTPSYFATSLGNISRANIIGIIVSKDQDGLILDDGSGKVLLRSFEDNSFPGIQVGDMIILIGRPRAYNDQRYILPEILKKIDSEWVEFRKIQIKLLERTKLPIEPETRVILSESILPTANYYQKITDFIQDLDTGAGADIGDIIKRSGVPNAEELIKKLIQEGEIFELKPGKLKLLD